MEEIQNSGVEVAAEAAQQEVTTEQGTPTTGEQAWSEAGAKGDPETAWEKRITSMRSKWEQETQQKYGDYDQLKAAAEQAKHLERVAKFNGYESPEDYLQAIEQAELQEQAQRLGVDPEVYRQQQELKSTVTDMQRKLQSYEMKDTRYSQDKTLEADPNLGELYKQFRDDVHQLADKANTDYDVAFTLLLRDKIPSLISGLKNQTEQEVLAKVTGRDDKQVLSSNDQPNNLMHTPSNMSFAEIEAISKRVQAGDKIKF